MFNLCIIKKENRLKFLRDNFTTLYHRARVLLWRSLLYKCKGLEYLDWTGAFMISAIENWLFLFLFEVFIILFFIFCLLIVLYSFKSRSTSYYYLNIFLFCLVFFLLCYFFQSVWFHHYKFLSCVCIYGIVSINFVSLCIFCVCPKKPKIDREGN